MERESTIFTKRLAHFIRGRRRANGMSQTELALLTGVGRRFLSELESGSKPTLRLDKVDAVLRVFGKQLGVVDREAPAE